MMKYFTKSEFKCQCCGKNKIDVGFLNRLDSARGLAGIPFNVNSGYRCPAHNTQVGSKSTSSHTKGLACDIGATSSSQRFAILSALLEVGFKRIGIAKTFIHVDYDKDKTSKVAWIY